MGRVNFKQNGKEKLHRLSIIISGEGVSQDLWVAELPSVMNHAIYKALNEWDIGFKDKVFGLSFEL